MQAYRKIASIVFAAALPIGLVAALSGGTAWAKTSAASGTVSCSGTSATISFKPPLTPTGTKKEKSALTGVSLGTCTDSNNNAATASKITAKISGTSSTDNCTNFATNTGADTVTITVKWAAKIAPSKIVFGPGSIALNSTDSGFNASGGKVTGSYAETDATFDVDISTADVTTLTNCVLGTSSTPISSISINGGTTSA